MDKKAKSPSIKEADLFEPVKEHLETLGYKVNGEIHSCDLVAQKDEELLVVELKKQLNLEVILQAVERQKISETVYIAVLKPEKFRKDSKLKRICHMLRRLEIGLMFVSLKKLPGTVEVVQLAEAFDRNKSRSQNKRKRNLVESEFSRRQTKTTGGVTRTKVMTAFREASISVANEIERLGESKCKDLAHLGLDNKKVQTILYKNYYGWFKRTGQGIYNVSDQWHKEKDQYQ